MSVGDCCPFLENFTFDVAIEVDMSIIYQNDLSMEFPIFFMHLKDPISKGCVVVL